MILPGSGRPGDTRNFVHKKLFGFAKGAVTGFLTSGSPFGALTGGIRGVAKTFAPRPTSRLAPAPAVPGRFGPLSSATFGACEPGFYQAPDGTCKPLGTTRRPGARAFVQDVLPFGETGRTEFGEAVMGQYGAALEPGIRPTETRVCPRGTVLGTDGLCYNRRDIKNSEREWPRGRRPLLTGGEMRCISVAASAAKKLDRKKKQLESMGMLKKPSPRRQRALPSGHHGHVEHD